MPQRLASKYAGSWSLLQLKFNNVSQLQFFTFRMALKLLLTRLAGI